MKIQYFQDTDTLYIEFKASKVAETRDLDENTLLAELRDWRRTISDEPQVNVQRLTDIAFACKLDDLWAEQTRHASVQKESIPIIICTEALV